MNALNAVRIAIAVAGLLVAGGLQAQGAAAYPNKPVKVIVPVAPGGSVDGQARMFSKQISEAIGQSFVVENRPTAGGASAFHGVAKAPADGYTILAVSPSIELVPATTQPGQPVVDPVKDFAHISLVAQAPYLLVVNPKLPVKSSKEFFALAKAKPGALNMGGTPIGNIVHLAALWLFSLADVKIIYVPYKGTGPSTAAVVSGEVDANMGSVVGIMPHVKSGKVRALAVSTAKRSKLLPDIPTIAEQGVPRFDFSTYHGWVAPAGTPAPVVKQLNAYLRNAVNDPEVLKILTRTGVEAVASSPEEFRKIVAAGVVRWKKLVEDNNLKVTN